MEKFKGFPAGELRFTAVPDLFFARLLPQIDSLAELKVTLHFLWVHYRQARQAISYSELLTDETLIQSLALIDEDIEAAFRQGLIRAVERGRASDRVRHSRFSKLARISWRRVDFRIAVPIQGGSQKSGSSVAR